MLLLALTSESCLHNNNTVMLPLSLLPSLPHSVVVVVVVVVKQGSSSRVVHTVSQIDDGSPRMLCIAVV